MAEYCTVQPRRVAELSPPWASKTKISSIGPLNCNPISRNNPSSTSSRRNPGQSGCPANCGTPPRGKGEKDWRLALRGKCFRCAKPDHMIPQCSYPESLKCNLCGAVGHTLLRLAVAVKLHRWLNIIMFHLHLHLHPPLLPSN